MNRNRPLTSHRRWKRSTVEAGKQAAIPLSNGEERAIWKWHFELNRVRAKPQSGALAALLSPEGDAVTTCPASESGERSPTLCVFTQQRDPRSNPEPCIAVPLSDRSDSDTASHKREREDREPSVYSRIPLCKLGDSASADWSLCAAPVLRGEPRWSANFRRVLSLQTKDIRSHSSHLRRSRFCQTSSFR
jgi:hypothetical protein